MAVHITQFHRMRQHPLIITRLRQAARNTRIPHRFINRDMRWHLQLAIHLLSVLPGTASRQPPLDSCRYPNLLLLLLCLLIHRSHLGLHLHLLLLPGLGPLVPSFNRIINLHTLLLFLIRLPHQIMARIYSTRPLLPSLHNLLLWLRSHTIIRRIVFLLLLQLRLSNLFPLHLPRRLFLLKLLRLLHRYISLFPLLMKLRLLFMPNPFRARISMVILHAHCLLSLKLYTHSSPLSNRRFPSSPCSNLLKAYRPLSLYPH